MYNLVQHKRQTVIHCKLRKALASWDLAIHDGWLPQRALNTLEAIKHLVPPRVTAAVWRAWCDGWCAHARFGIRTESRCGWGCSADGGDSIKGHYYGCPKLFEFSRKCLRLETPEGREAKKLNFLILDGNLLKHKENAALRALRLYTAYWTHNLARHWGG